MIPITTRDAIQGESSPVAKWISGAAKLQKLAPSRGKDIIEDNSEDIPRLEGEKLVMFK
jgi:hypothetical protein